MDGGHWAANGRSPTRRQVIGLAGGGLGALVTGRATDNVLLGYGGLVGTNLRDQAESGALAALVWDGLLTGPADVSTPGGRLVRRGALLTLQSPDGTAQATLSLSRDTVADARAVDREYGLEGAATQVFTDLKAVRAGDVTTAFSRTAPFFGRALAATRRPYTTGLARGEPTADPDTVAAFAGVDAASTRRLVGELVEGFREHTYYDVPRYMAGSIQDNILLRTVDLRRHFRDPVDFPSLLAGGETGVFCYEYVARSREAFQALPATAQTVPIAAGLVHDTRHKHAYTVLATVMRENDDLVVPVTFLDYTHATLYDDLRLRGLLGEGVEAYNDRHRAGTISWS